MKRNTVSKLEENMKTHNRYRAERMNLADLRAVWWLCVLNTLSVDFRDRQL